MPVTISAAIQQWVQFLALGTEYIKLTRKFCSKLLLTFNLYSL